MFFKTKILSDVIENNEGLKIIYDDVAPYAKEHSRPQVINPGLYPSVGRFPGRDSLPKDTAVRAEFPDLKKDNLSYPGYAMCLPGFSMLDGKYVNFPDNAVDYGYISDEISGEDGRFPVKKVVESLIPHKSLHPNTYLFPKKTIKKGVGNPILTILFSQKFTSVGLLLTFSQLSGDYCTDLNVKWYSGGNLLSDMRFAPDSERYFCNNYVVQYDKITITFMETSKPSRPVFITRIDYGIYRDFLSDEIMETSCLQEINAISENISINTLGFTVRTKTNIPFDFQKKQKLSMFFNGKRIGNFYLKNGARKNVTDYRMNAHDAIGVLDGSEYQGGVYAGQSAYVVIDDIFKGEDFDYLLDDTFRGEKLYGYIPYTTKRNALMQIAFAIGAIVDTSNYDGVIIYRQSKELQEFSPDETFDNITLEHSDIVTGIRLTAHSYQRIDETQELYNGVLNGTAELIFSEPYHSLMVNGGLITRSGDNFAYVTGTGGTVTISGKKYAHTTTSSLKENPLITYNKKIVEVDGATLVHPSISQAVLDRVYQYYQRAENVVGDVLAGNKTIGQIVSIDTGYDGKRTGTIESYHYRFSKKEMRAEVKIHE